MHDADLAGGVVINDQRDTFGLEEPEATALAVAVWVERALG